MSIDRISPYGGFYDRYKVAEIQRVSVEDVKKQDEQLDKQQGVQRSVVPAQWGHTAERHYTGNLSAGTQHGKT